MSFISDGWPAISAFLIFLLGGVLSFFLPGLFGIGKGRGFFLYLWHTLWCMAHLIILQYIGGDANMYYSVSVSENFRPFEFGTIAVIYFTSFFSGVMGLSMLGVFLVNNVFGYIGFLGFAGSLKAVTYMKSDKVRLLAFFIILLPSVSYWSSALGKDSISFMATGLALWAALDFQRRMSLMYLAILSMLFVRPHMAGMMIIALSVAFVFHANVSLIKRVFIGAVTVTLAAFLIPFSLQYSGMGESSDITAFMSYVEARQGYNQQGGGGVDISSMSPPMQLFTYMFRPLIFEARSILQLASAVDNTILMFLFLAGGIAIWKGRNSPVRDARIFLWIYSLLAWAVLSVTTANMGIAMRQKWMFAPMLIYLMLSVMGQVSCRRKLKYI